MDPLKNSREVGRLVNEQVDALLKDYPERSHDAINKRFDEKFGSLESRVGKQKDEVCQEIATIFEEVVAVSS